MNRLAYWGLCLSALGTVFFSGCTSSRRLMKNSPFAETNKNLPGEDRVYMWPLVYHDSGNTSILWPFVDFDTDGFAVRPLIAKNNEDWSLFWPISGWNTRSNEGWFLNGYWDTDEHVGLFPLAHVNWKRDLGWCGTAYWDDDAFGIFPLGHWGEMGYMTLAYWADDAWGVFPVTYVAKDGSRGYIGPAYWGEDNVGVFPLFNVGDDFSFYGPIWNTSESLGLFPLYRYSDYGGTLEQSLLFRLGFWRAGEGEHRSWLAPLYYHHRTKESVLTASLLGGSYEHGNRQGKWFLPGYWSETEGDSYKRLLFPLYFGGKSADESLHVTPLTAWHKRGGESNRWIFPSWVSRTAGDDYRNMLLPFWLSEKKDDEYTKILLPFFYSNSKADRHAFLTPLGGYGWSDSSTDHFSNILGLLYYHHESEDGDFSLTGCMWPLYTGWKSGDTSNHLLPLIYRSSHNPRETKISCLAELGQYHRDSDSSSWMLWPLVSQSNRSELPCWAWDKTFFHFYNHGNESIARYTPFAQFSTDGDRSRSWVFPFYGYQAEPNEKNLNYLFWVGNYHDTDKGNSWRFWPLLSSSKESKRPDFLYYLSLFSAHEYGNRSSWMFTPLVGSSRISDVRKSRIFPLAWWERDSSKNTYKANWLIGTGGAKADENGTAVRQFPAFSHASGSKEPGLFHYLNLLSRYAGETKEQYGITPLINYKSNPSGHDAWIFPLSYSHKEDDESDFYALAGLYHHGTTAEKSAVRITPLFSYASGTDVGDSLYGFNAVGILNKPDHKKYSLMGSILMSYESRKEDDSNSSTWRYLLFGKSWNRRFVDDDIPASSRGWRQTQIENDGSFFYPIYRNEAKRIRVWKDAELTKDEMKALEAWWAAGSEDSRYRYSGKKSVSDEEIQAIMKRCGVEAKGKVGEELRDVVLQYAMENSEIQTRKQIRSLIYRYTRDYNDVSWKVLFGLINYKYTENDDRSRFSILRYLYARDREKGQVRRSFFPFIKWDSGAEKSDVSFCWRLWHRRKENGKVGGHFLFIPWGDI